MIVRERSKDFVLIQQDDHARISGDFARLWRDDYFIGNDRRKEVETAVAEHDRGWIAPDSEPFIDDKTGKPYSFSDFPLNTKLVLYKHGINETEAANSYAGLLSSYHYMKFIEGENTSEAKVFVHMEKERQKRIIRKTSHFNKDIFLFHYDLLKLCDNLSLYLCLNEPGVLKSEEHPWFQKGIPVPKTFNFIEVETFDVSWLDKKTVLLSPFPFTDKFTVLLKYKCVEKEEIKNHGLIEAYQRSPWMELRILLTGESGQINGV
ncbi:DUF3891 family protein [Scopulibacillus cellulosilyticus]|uniref:DUF3891 family protein n=1 Tax=Scopulibacillus cellulosilyticus TaxID=2665665 RepID=A0ABW2Q163_9BACL